jgi:hypothetical protein
MLLDITPDRHQIVDLLVRVPVQKAVVSENEMQAGAERPPDILENPLIRHCFANHTF